MTNRLEDDIQRNVESMNNQENQESETHTPQEGIQDIYVLIVREHEEEEEHPQVVESPPVFPQKTSLMPAYAICCFYLLLIVSTLAFQLYCMFNPPITTVTIIPKSQTVTLTGTLQIGRLLNPITISQSQTTQTTGKGHQEARSATGFITFYNALFTSQTVDAGSVFTGAYGVQVVTEETVTIPANNPPQDGQATTSAHALLPGSKGNIQALDINGTFSSALYVKNLAAFIGGADERNFQTVAKRDIDSLSIPLKTSLAQSMSAAMQSQLTPQEQLQLFPCTPQVASDHAVGAEATQVKVSVSATCSAVAYNNQELAQKATDLLSHQAIHTVGAGYSLLGDAKVTVTQAIIPTAHTKPVILSFHASGTWIYGLTHTAQEQTKHLIAGKTKQEALHLLASLPGVERVSMQWGDDTRLPKDTGYIHLTIFVV